MERRTFFLAFPFFTVFGLLLTMYKHLDDITRHAPPRFGARLIEELAGAYGAWLMLPLIVMLVLRFGVPALQIHVPAVALYSAVHTTFNLCSRKALFVLFAMGDYNYGRLGVRYWMEFPNDILVYATSVALIWLADRYRQTHERELALARAELDNLRLQLQPHFLFNSLNTISSVMFEDPARADTMMTRLTDLLRLVLRNPPVQEVQIEEEVGTLQVYLDIMRMRFGEKLQVECRVDPSARHGMVPYMILQPLVENAIRHGATPGSSDVRVTMNAHRDRDNLVLQIIDYGPGIGDPRSNGIGLKNTSERLTRLYGQNSKMSLENRNGAGLAVAIRIPFRTA